MTMIIDLRLGKLDIFTEVNDSLHFGINPCHSAYAYNWQIELGKLRYIVSWKRQAIDKQTLC